MAPFGGRIQIVPCVPGWKASRTTRTGGGSETRRAERSRPIPDTWSWSGGIVEQGLWALSATGCTSLLHWANANQAAATDIARVITLADELRVALVEKGLTEGGL